MGPSEGTWLAWLLIVQKPARLVAVSFPRVVTFFSFFFTKKIYFGLSVESCSVVLFHGRTVNGTYPLISTSNPCRPLTIL